MKMLLLRVILACITLVIHGYTMVAIFKEGWNLFPAVYSGLSSLGWQGQFNTDLLCFIFLSMFWVMWREKFSLTGVVLGLVAFNGMYFFAPYLLYLTFKAEGDMRVFLLGEHAT